MVTIYKEGQRVANLCSHQCARALVVRAMGGHWCAQVGLEVGMKFAEVVPQTNPAAQFLRFELSRKTGRKPGDLFQVGREVVLDATVVFRMREGHSAQFSHIPG